MSYDGMVTAPKYNWPEDQEEEDKTCFVCGYEPQEWDVKLTDNGKLADCCPKCECEQ